MASQFRHRSYPRAVSKRGRSARGHTQNRIFEEKVDAVDADRLQSQSLKLARRRAALVTSVVALCTMWMVHLMNPRRPVQ